MWRNENALRNKRRTRAKINLKYYTNITKKAQRLQLYYIIQQMLTPKNGYVNINLYRVNF